MSFTAVFIDDCLMKTDAFVQSIRKACSIKPNDLHVYQDPNEGLEYVLKNLSARMIVFIDWNFGSSKEKGIDLLRVVREMTSLLYVVIMSANSLRQNVGSDKDIIEMINQDNIFYLDRSNSDVGRVKSIVGEIRKQWTTKFDCILEEWLVRHPEDNYKEAFTDVAEGKTYTWADILPELRRQSEIGKSFEGRIHSYYIDFLNRSRK